jgi:proteasome lid subunit RPN8/RPN11
VVDVYLSLPAFLTIVSSAAEVYRQETVGYLVGYPTKSNFVVEYAVPFQAVDSSDSIVYVDENRTARINRIINRLAEGLEIVGTFHSHAGLGSRKALPLPSDADVNHVLPDEIELIVALNTIYGTVDNLHVEIGGFMRTESGRGWKRLHINCSPITGVRP